MSGLSKSKITKFSVSPEGNAEIRVLIPSGGFDGPYSIEGQLLKMKIKGKGMLKCTVSELLIVKFILIYFIQNLFKKTWNFG